MAEETTTQEELLAQNAELAGQIADLQEQWDEAAATLLRIRNEDVGWRPLGQTNPEEEGFSLRVSKEVAKAAEIQGVGNPLLKRGFKLRYDGIFSRGFRVKGDVKPRTKRKIEHPDIQRVLFDDDAWETNERSLFNTGNFFFAYNRTTGEGRRVPFEEITNRAVDPDDRDITAYYQRTYTRHELDGSGRTQEVTVWYPLLEWAESGKDSLDEIGGIAVDHDWTVIDLRVNVPSTGHWGIADSFAALPYAWAYGEYIRDASSLLKALATIAWKVVGKSKTQAQRAGVQLTQARKPGSAAVMTDGTDFTSMPKAGQVDMSDGNSLAAMVASSLEVPLPALLSNPSIGSYGSVAALDGPTVAMARSRQGRWRKFYERLFRAMDAKGLSIDFPKITEDPVHRQVSSLATGRATGAIHADEYRAAFLEATDVTPMHDAPPPVEEYAQAQNALGFLQAMMSTGQAGPADPIARQGNSGVAGRLGEIDNTNRDLDTKPGTGSMTGLVG